MSVATYIIIGVQVVLCLILIAVILFQSGNQRGLSGSIAGGAETFFGKNKGRTIDAKLKKVTAIVSVLFLASSIALAYMVDKDNSEPAPQAPVQVEAPENEEAETPVEVPEGAEAPSEGETETPAQ